MYKLYQYIDGELKQNSLSDFLQVRKKDIISFAGAGGKTSTIFALANELKDMNYRVLITTTTKMFLEKEAITVQDEKIIEKALQKNKSVIAGTDLGKKMGAFDEDFLKKIINYSDVTLIEADGAQRKPFKMPRDYEPVYIENTNKIVYVVGMTSLGQEIKNLSRADIIADFLVKSLDEKLSVKDMIKILLSEKGAKKDIGKRDFYIILNQVDNEVLLQYAMEISSVLNKYGIQIALTKYKI